MKNLNIKNILLVFLLCSIFYNAWIEDILEEKRDFITYEKPATTKSIRETIREPFNKIPELFDELNTEFEKLIKEKGDFDKYFNEIIILTNLAQEKEIITEYKGKYLPLNQHVAEFSNVLFSRKNDLDTAIQKVKKNADDLKSSYHDKGKRAIINSEADDVQKDYEIYTDWLTIALGNTVKILGDLILANMKFESRINQAPEGLEIPEPQEITKFTPPPLGKLLPAVVSNEKGTNLITEKEEVKEKKEEDVWEEIEKSDLKEDLKQSEQLYNSGNDSYKKGELDEAMNNYKESVKHNKKNYHAIAGISKVYIKKKKYDESINIINIAIKTFKKTKTFDYYKFDD